MIVHGDRLCVSWWKMASVQPSHLQQPGNHGGDVGVESQNDSLTEILRFNVQHARDY